MNSVDGQVNARHAGEESSNVLGGVPARVLEPSPPAVICVPNIDTESHGSMDDWADDLFTCGDEFCLPPFAFGCTPPLPDCPPAAISEIVPFPRAHPATLGTERLPTIMPVNISGAPVSEDSNTFVDISIPLVVP